MTATGAAYFLAASSGRVVGNDETKIAFFIKRQKEKSCCEDRRTGWPSDRAASGKFLSKKSRTLV